MLDTVMMYIVYTLVYIFICHVFIDSKSSFLETLDSAKGLRVAAMNSV